MGVCTIIAAAIVNCVSAQATSPADAVRVLTSHTQPYVYVAPRPFAIPERQVAHNPAWPFLTPSRPMQPLAPPWSVTTYYGRNHVETFFNGRSFTSPREQPRPGTRRPHTPR